MYVNINDISPTYYTAIVFIIFREYDILCLKPNANDKLLFTRSYNL